MATSSYRSYPRSKRIASEIQRLLSQIIDDTIPANYFITVTSVEVSPDCRHARVLVDSSGLDAALGLKLLEQYNYDIKRKLAKQIRLKKLPSLSFYYLNE